MLMGNPQNHVGHLGAWRQAFQAAALSGADGVWRGIIQRARTHPQAVKTYG